MAQVLANAVVDVVKPATPVGLGLFYVEVWGVAPYDYTRTYEIQAETPTPMHMRPIVKPNKLS